MVSNDEDAAGAPEASEPDASGVVIDFGLLAPTAPVRGKPKRDWPRPAIRSHHGAGGPRRWATWLPIALAACVVAAVAIHISSDDASRDAVANPTPTPTVATPDRAGLLPPDAGPVYFETPKPILGITNSWELFGYGGGEVIRIQFGDGGVTRTSVPTLDSSGPVSFLAGRGWAMVRPLDNVPGYLVRSARTAADLPRRLNDGGPAIAGPDDDDVWMTADADGGDQVRLDLVDITGRLVGPRISVPASLAWSAQSDGAGYLVVTSTNGAYSARPGGLHRITTGQLLAIGPTKWLALECDGSYRCAMKVIDRATGARRTFTGAEADQLASTRDSWFGAIAPDGATAALVVADAAGGQAIHLINLDTGTDRRLSVPLSDTFRRNAIVYSPDSRWLFVAGSDGVLYAVHTADGAGQAVGVNLPPLQQLAMYDAER